MARAKSPFRELGSRPRRIPAPGSKSRFVKTDIPKSPSYARIEQEVNAALAGLSVDKQATLPPSATLPERIVGLALIFLGYQFQAQRIEDGGRIRIGGSIVDFIVYGFGHPVIIRVQGDYWHSLPERKRSDVMQADRLRAKRYRVVDLWEGDLYRAWVEGRYRQLVEQAVLNAL